MSTLLWIILACIVNGLIAFSGAIALLFSKKVMHKLLMVLVAFSAGALLSGAFFHLIAESFENTGSIFTFTFVISGFIFFFLMEKFLFWHHCHDEECEERVKPFNYLILWGDAIHNIIDGIIIAASFIVSIPFGITTSILIMAHEIPQELGNFGVLVYGGFSKSKALFYNFMAQMSCIIGGILGFLFSGISKFTEVLVPLAAGGFIYIAASDLIPELRQEKSLAKSLLYMLAFIAGVALLLWFKILFE